MQNPCKLLLDNEQQNALQLMLSGRNVFLTGEAGTGKSAVIHEFEHLCRKELVKLAPTGIAARNINGETIHSFFGFGTTILTPESLSEDISYDLQVMLQTVEVILIDEISMVRSDLFSAMDFKLRTACKTQQPFGGKQIIAVGDFLQLPPSCSGSRNSRLPRTNFW